MPPFVAQRLRYSSLSSSVECSIDGSLHDLLHLHGCAFVVTRGDINWAHSAGHLARFKPVDCLGVTVVPGTVPPVQLYVVVPIVHVWPSLEVGLVEWVNIVPDDEVDVPFLQVSLFAVIFVVNSHVLVGHKRSVW